MTTSPTLAPPVGGSVRAADHAGYNKYAQRAVIGAALSTFWSGALIFGYPGVMKSIWAQKFDASPGQLGWIMTFVVVSLGIFTFFAGKWHMKLGTRRSYLVGTAILVVSMLIVIYSPNIWLIYLFAFLNGTASCFVYSPSLATVQNWYPHRRGLVTGIVNLVFGLSAAVMSPLFQVLFDKFGYAAMGWITIGAIVITNVIAAMITEMPDRTPLTPEQQEAREEVFANAASAANGTAPAPDVEPKIAVKTRSFWFIWLAWCFMGAAGISMVTLSTGYGEFLAGQGFAVTAVALLTAFNLTNGFSRILAGALSDVIGRNLLGAISFVLAAVGYFVLPFTHNMVALCVLCALVGFAFGTLFAITAPLGTDLFGLKYFGLIFGYIFTAYGFVGGLVGPLLSSYVLGKTGSYTVVFAYLGVFCLLAALFIMLAKPKNRQG
ncbi:MAG: MFS transporter [Actinomycetaceae bacterium]|nr:MFS transporter [Arcanobacterium sp.]MDD7504539.1 MFS transporter [Actinomycetaceae bacterium]MDY6143182.1 MFS transporter [Arcanobacterium sp.]